MKRPELNEIPLREAMAGILGGGGGLIITMSVGQWDGFLQAAYDNGATLLELDENEMPIRAYQKRMNA